MRCRFPLLLVLLLAALRPEATRAGEGQAFRLLVEREGVYRVGFEELRAAGLATSSVAAAQLALTHRGAPVPLWVLDGGDGDLGPGDSLEFVGDVLHGTHSHFSPHSRTNVYRLTTAGVEPAPTRRLEAAPPAPGAAAAELSARLHLEEDRLLIRLAPEELEPGEEEPELWFWHKLTHIDRAPLTLELALPGLADDSRPIALRAMVRGLSRPGEKPSTVADHRLEVRVGAGEGRLETWDGTGTMAIEVPDLRQEGVATPHTEISFRVPRLRPDGARHPLVDVVLLNRLEVDYPHAGRIDGPVRLAVSGPPGGALSLATGGPSLVLYGSAGSRLAWSTGTGLPETTPLAAPGDAELWAVPGGALLSPAAIEEDRPSDLRRTSRQADYLVLAHHTLLDAVRPLVELHRGSGLTVDLIDVQDVYDELNHGIVHPRAIRDFLAWAYHRWQAPAPRFVLLVGDASWDVHSDDPDTARYANWTDRGLIGRGDAFPPVALEEMPNAVGAARNLIPTWMTMTRHGHAAADGWLAAVDGDDFQPDLAIGRFPVTTPEEVAAIVEKSIAHVLESGLGPWRRRTLLVTNEWPAYQLRSDRLARLMAPWGFAARKVYPAADEADNLEHQETLLAAFAEGGSLVHFIGHGGRFIWRTGPPDLDKNHDLFTLDDLDRLRPHRRLPVLVSLTCFSGPFDHPSADSIGEKFLRIPGRGAVAVVASSWRSNPGEPLSYTVAEAFRGPGTVGEAFLAMKHRIDDRALNEGYNLLGDPALPLAVPQRTLPVDLEEAVAPRRLRVALPGPGFQGRVSVDWYDVRGTVLQSDESDAAGPQFVVEVPEALAPAGVSLYAWDDTRGVDAAGGLELTEERP